MTPRFDLLVIGGGPAGVTAALRARELCASTAIVERDRLGGTCTDDGCAPTRVLARAARMVRDGQRSSAFGLVGSAPRVDLPRLLEHAQRTVYRLHEKKQLAAHLRSLGAEVFEEAGSARFVDPWTVELADGRQLAAERTVICVGGHARRLPLPGAELALTHSDVWSLRALPASLAVVGASATGTQLASIFAAFGSRVTLLEVASRILPGEDPLVSSVMSAALQERGVEVRAGIGAIGGIERNGRGLRVSVGEEMLPVDSVILAVGWPGNVGDIGLETAGVAVERGHVVVDESLRTSAPHIYAAGDVTGRMMLVQSATAEARVAVTNALSGTAEQVPHTVVPHGSFTDPEYASVGTMTDATAVVGYDELDRAVIDGRTEGFAKLAADAEGKLAGASVVGEQAVEVVQVAAAAMAGGMRLEQLADLELAYPTYAAILGLAARRLLAKRQGLADSRWHTIASAPPAEWEWREPAS
jgi:pyruvate/2-oxoglutarate dehydrogenase complex dihydrolipoamide dehydrogenase (E3) component